MKSHFLSFAAAATLFQLGVAAQFNATAFCEVRPLGLYCDPTAVNVKIECPSGERFNCPKGDEEQCQERGILRQYGFRGGIARCVPRLESADVAEFCSSRARGVYCWGDEGRNIRIQCPTGIIWKCREDGETADDRFCAQTTDTYATCETDGGGGGVGSPVPTCESAVTRTLISTETETVSRTISVAASTITQTLVRTETVTETLEPEPFVTTTTKFDYETSTNFQTTTIVSVITDSSVITRSTVETETITPSVVTLTGTDCLTTSTNDGGASGGSQSIVFVSSEVSGVPSATISGSVSLTSYSETISATSTADGGAAGASESIVFVSSEVSDVPSATSSGSVSLTSSSDTTYTSTADGGAAGASESIVFVSSEVSEVPSVTLSGSVSLTSNSETISATSSPEGGAAGASESIVFVSSDIFGPIGSSTASDDSSATITATSSDSSETITATTSVTTSTGDIDGGGAVGSIIELPSVTSLATDTLTSGSESPASVTISATAAITSSSVQVATSSASDIGGGEGVGSVIDQTSSMSKMPCEGEATPSLSLTSPPEPSPTGDIEGGGEASGDPEVVIPQPANCTNGQQLELVAPPNTRFTYRLTPSRIIERDVAAACRSLGGRMAFISTSNEHWYLGLQLCEPVWYKRWAGNDFDDYYNSTTTTLVGSQQGEIGCLALYPGGATGVPVNRCDELLYGLCKFNA